MKLLSQIKNLWKGPWLAYYKILSFCFGLLEAKVGALSKEFSSETAESSIMFLRWQVAPSQNCIQCHH